MLLSLIIIGAFIGFIIAIIEAPIKIRKCKKANQNIESVSILNNGGNRTTFEVSYKDGKHVRETVPTSSWRYLQLIEFVR